jgi:hypothetical protein
MAKAVRVFFSRAGVRLKVKNLSGRASLSWRKIKKSEKKDLKKFPGDAMFCVDAYIGYRQWIKGKNW